MLKKLLKYDFRAILKYWWILALSSVALAVIGGIAFRTFIDLSAIMEPTGIQIFITIMSFIGMFASIIGLSAFLIATEIFIYVRLYRHLFSDEGYLTFTLPVKRRDILNSKIISGFIINSASVLLLAFDIILMLIIIFGAEASSRIAELFSIIGIKIFKELGILSAVYIIELLLFFVAASVAAYLIIAVCITFAAIIAKKAKLFAAIGLYYGVSAVGAFLGQIISVFGVIALGGLLSSIPETTIPGILALLIFGICTFIYALTYLLYTLELYMLEKKLNLS